MKEVLLDWQGPYEFSSLRQRSVFAAPAAEQGGLYLWAVETESGYLIHYVGETKAGFAKRHYEHFCEYTAGAYTFHDPDSFAAGQRKPLYTGFNYPRYRWQRAQEFIDRFGVLATHLARFIDLLRIFLAPINTDQRTRRRIEGALVRLLYAGEGDVGSFQQDKMRTWSRRADEEPISVRSTSPALLRGVPAAFEA